MTPELTKEEQKEEGNALLPPPPAPTATIRNTKAVKKQTRDKCLFKAEAGCTIDSYQPDPRAMGAWAVENAPAVQDPVSPTMVDEIKDVWRRRGEKPKDFDATYRIYLRKRQSWAAEKLNGSGATRSRAAI